MQEGSLIQLLCFSYEPSNKLVAKHVLTASFNFMGLIY